MIFAPSRCVVVVVVDGNGELTCCGLRFGHDWAGEGLSYTTFESKLHAPRTVDLLTIHSECDRSILRKDTSVVASVDVAVKNTGTREGDEIVQGTCGSTSVVRWSVEYLCTLPFTNSAMHLPDVVCSACSIHFLLEVSYYHFCCSM